MFIVTDLVSLTKKRAISLFLGRVITTLQKTHITTAHIHGPIIPTHCCYRFFGDFDWSVGKIKSFLHFDKNPCVGIFDNYLDFTKLDCVDNNELYRKLYYFY